MNPRKNEMDEDNKAAERRLDNKRSNPDICGCQRGDGAFCGTDGLCHFYNCESFYEFGPVDITGT
jgi:hypothetical protein